MSDEKRPERFMTVDEILSIVSFVADHVPEEEREGARGTAAALRTIASDTKQVTGLFRSMPDMTKAEDDQSPRVAIATMFYHALERLHYGTPDMATALDADIAEEHMKKAAAVSLFRSGYKAGEDKPNKHCWAAVRALAVSEPVPGTLVETPALPPEGREARVLDRSSEAAEGARHEAPVAVQAERSCRTCQHLGSDPDGPYCVEPTVAEGHPAGIALSSPKVAARCPAPASPHWQLRQVKG